MLEREELDAQIKELQAKAKAFFEQAGKEQIEVYRIEKFEPVRQDPKFLGKFYDGDSYVILFQGEKAYDIHYWHGKNSSGDEQATAAAFTVQLSDNLKLPSRHHLELMMEESQQFLSYFKGGIFYLEGGVESGFKHVEPKTYEKKLYIVKGKRYPRVWTKEISGNSLNEGDVFILDLGMKLYFWPGTECNVNEKVKGMEVLFNIKNGERGSLAKHYYPREDAEADVEFWAELGGKPAKINPAIPDDNVQEGASEDADTKYALYKVSNETGKLEMNEITERPLRKDHLDTNDTFILELNNLIYVWIGKKANTEEKKMGMLYAKDFIQQKGKPSNTRITRLPEFGEDTHFKSFFNGFYPMIKQDFSKAKNLDPNALATGEAEVEKMANKQREASKKLFEKLQGFEMTVYFCDWSSGQPYPLDKEEWGHFYSDDTYLIDLKAKDHRYIVMWIGPRLNYDQYSETSKFFDILTNYTNSYDITRQRVQRGHEEESLLSLFPQGFMIYMGSRQGNVSEKVAQIKSTGSMFRIQAPYGDSARAIEQASVKCENLNSGDAYIVSAPGGEAVYLWLGEGANEAEKELGKKIFTNYFSSASVKLEMKESGEPEEFWNAFEGGKTEYSNSKATGIASGFDPRLFHASNAQGFFHVEEVPNFTQDDMMNDDIMLLDAYTTIYVWIGNGSNKFERNGAFKTANRYITSVRDERDKSSVQVVEVEAGREPPSFTVHFPEWRLEKAQQWLEADPSKRLAEQNPADKAKGKVEESKGGNPFGAQLKSAKTFVPGKPAPPKEQSSGPSWLKKSATVVEDEAKKPEPAEDKTKYLDSESNKFDYEVLKGAFPSGVNPEKKEAYLSDENFQSIFGMTPAAFNDLKKWKQNELKKAKGLF